MRHDGLGEVSSPTPLLYQQFDHRSHVVQFYSDDGFLLEELCRFVGTALSGGDAAVVIASQARRDGLSSRLRLRGFDIAAAIENGRYIHLDAAEILSKFMLDGRPDRDLFRDVIGQIIAKATLRFERKQPRIAAFGEMVALLWAEEKTEAAVQVEQLWNEVAGGHPLSLRCAYPLSGFNRTEHAEALLRICEQHAAVIPEESYTELRSEEGRLRAIAQLQQKARALGTEMAERLRVRHALLASQEALRRSHDELEQRVRERTQELIEAQTALRELSGRLLTLRDEERRRLARELHDSTGQTLAAIQLNLAMVQNGDGASTQQKSKRLAEAISLADQAMKEIRTLSYLLHPPMLDEAGLLLAIEWYVAGFVERSKIDVDLSLPSTLHRLPHDMEVAIFRIVQEALTNVQRHSRSSRARVHISVKGNQLEIVIADSGRGLAQEVLRGRTGVGINGMRERARQFGGELQLTSGNPGTCVKVGLPLSAANAVSDLRLTAV